MGAQSIFLLVQLVSINSLAVIDVNPGHVNTHVSLPNSSTTPGHADWRALMPVFPGSYVPVWECVHSRQYSPDGRSQYVSRTVLISGSLAALQQSEAVHTACDANWNQTRSQFNSH